MRCTRTREQFGFDDLPGRMARRRSLFVFPPSSTTWQTQPLPGSRPRWLIFLWFAPGHARHIVHDGHNTLDITLRARVVFTTKGPTRLGSMKRRIVIGGVLHYRATVSASRPKKFFFIRPENNNRCVVNAGPTRERRQTPVKRRQLRVFSRRNVPAVCLQLFSNTKLVSAGIRRGNDEWRSTISI